ncbi:unnamed protein product [Rotaria sp. Silwood2]|nr:unnamed protein product [Rotaria sp. Silwood2]CAF2784390.1 unnamed protein product [Rotaria sp. Silwood2]CAF4261788.1 unnamed protein product [Rotaria sp. Silwood2]CAF4398421.1 unnamed protein product [Rotaria sp. Silwood2]
MFSLIVLSLLFVISTDGAHDLKIYFDLIDLNRDGKATSYELGLFFERFYEEKFETLASPTSPMSPTTIAMLDNLIKRHNRNSTRNYLIMDDLQRTFYELYGLQNQVLDVVYHGLDPEQVHLSYTHNVHNQMFISFVTRERPTSNLRPMIKYGDQGYIAIGDTTTYNVNGWHHWIHYILIDNLQPGTKYSYQLGFIKSDNKTIPYIFSNGMWTFKTMPLWEERQREIVYIYGDMGTFMPMGIEVMKAIVGDFINNTNEQSDYVVHVGDIAYGGTGAEIEIQPIWDLFMNQIAPIASQIPYMTATGNHEKYFNYTSYQARFFMPSKTDPNPLEDGGNFYFTLETNLVQWIFISTEHDYTAGSSQRLFLENVLEQYRQKWQFKQRPWLIVVGHRPMYTSDQGANAGQLQEELEPLVVEYGVDLAVWGHMHCYERTTPVKFNNVTDREHFSPDGKVYKHNATAANQTSPIHLTIGMAGALINETWFPKPEWSQVRYATFGFGKLYIHNESHLEFKTILLDPSLANEEDRFMIVREF